MEEKVFRSNSIVCSMASGIVFNGKGLVSEVFGGKSLFDIWEMKRRYGLPIEGDEMTPKIDFGKLRNWQRTFGLEDVDPKTITMKMLEAAKVK